VSIERCSDRTTPARPLALPARSRQAGVDPLLNAGALKLRDAREDARDEPARRCTRVDALTNRDERHAARLPVVEHEYEVSQIAAETIEAPAHDAADAMPTHVGDELVERWPC
jgi:hypothetical protein